VSTRLPWIALAFLVAALVHMGTLYLVPRIVMARALDELGAVNTMHAGQPNPFSRSVARMSPDLLYASCPYDLSKGPLRVTAVVPYRAYYWSVSAYDSATDNFFVRNDQQIAGNSVEIVIIKRGQGLPALGNAPERIVLIAPSDRGLILLRTVIDDEKHEAALAAALRQSSCGTVASKTGLR